MKSSSIGLAPLSVSPLRLSVLTGPERSAKKPQTFERRSSGRLRADNGGGVDIPSLTVTN